MAIEAYTKQTLFYNGNVVISDPTNAPTHAKHIELNATQVFAVWNDVTNGLGKCRIGTKITDYCIEWETEYAFNTGNTAYIIPVRISDNKVLIVYQDVGNSSYGTSIACSISGTVITFGTKVVFNSATTTPVGASLMDTDKVMIAYANSTTNGQAIIASLTGTTIAYGAAFTFKATTDLSTYPSQQQLCAVSTTKAVVVYRVSATVCNAQCLNVSGTTITGATEYQFGGSIDGRYPICTNLTSTTFMVVYQSVTDSNSLRGFLGTISTNAISYGTVIIIGSGNDSANLRRPSIATYNSTSIVVFSNTENLYIATVYYVTSGGTVTTIDNTFISNLSSSRNPSAASSLFGSVSVSNGIIYCLYKDGNLPRTVLAGADILGGTPRVRNMLFKIAEAGVGEQVEISGINIQKGNAAVILNLYLNDNLNPFISHNKSTAIADMFSDYSGNNFQLLRAGCPLILTSGQKLYANCGYYYLGDTALTSLITGLKRT